MLESSRQAWAQRVYQEKLGDIDIYMLQLLIQEADVMIDNKYRKRAALLQ